MKKPVLLFIAKLLVACELVALVLQIIDPESLREQIGQLHPVYTLLAFVLLNISIVISAFRLKRSYALQGVAISSKALLQVTYAGLGANIFIPGGVGGDAYRIMQLKQAGLSAKEALKLHLQNRASGLLAILLWVGSLALLLDIPLYLKALAVLGMLVSAVSYALLAKRLLKETKTHALAIIPYSLAVQACVLGCVVVLLLPLVPAESLLVYAVLTGIAAVASMIPISVGGLGLRELTFVYGVMVLQMFSDVHLDESVGVLAGLTVFFLTLCSALVGLIWWVMPHGTMVANSKFASAMSSESVSHCEGQ